MIIKKRTAVYVVILLLLAVFIYILVLYRERIGKILTPFIMAMIIAYLLNPLVLKLESRKIPRTVSILLIYLAFSIFLATVIVFIIPELINNTRELISTVPEISKNYEALFNKLVSAIQSSNWSDDIKNVIFKEIQDGTVIAQTYIVNTLKKSLTILVRTVTMLFDLVLAMIIAYYLIKDSNFFRESFLAFVPRKWRNGFINSGRDVNAILSSFIQGQLLTALIVGIMETIGLFIVKVKYPLVLGLLGGAANIIPYFGPIIGSIPAIAVALIESPFKAALAALVFIVVQQIDNAFISPKIIEGRLGLHPVTTILAVLIGGEFFGIVGMLVSVPVAAIVKAVLKRLVESIV